MIGKFFEHLSMKCTQFAGSSVGFATALVIVIVWAFAGPYFKYSETWQIVINTATTIVTFLMVFLIQRTQNKDVIALHAKLNELIAAQEGASNRLVNIEDLDEEQLEDLRTKFHQLSDKNDTTTAHKSIEDLVAENQQLKATSEVMSGKQTE